MSSSYYPAYTPSQCASYLHRLSLLPSPSTTALPPPTRSLLFAVHHAHLTHIPFETLSIHFDPSSLSALPAESSIPYRKGPGITIDTAHLHDKLITRRAGGFCFELNTALATLLRGLGFVVKIRIGRSNFAARGNVRVEPEWSGLSHCVLMVSLPRLPSETLTGPIAEEDTKAMGATYVADVGFGGGGIFSPLLVEAGSTNTHLLDPATRYTLRRGCLPGVPDAAEDTEQGWTCYKMGPGTWMHELPIFHAHDAFVHLPGDVSERSAFIAADEDGAYVARTGLAQLLFGGVGGVPSGGIRWQEGRGEIVREGRGKSEGTTIGGAQKVMLLNREKDEQGSWVLKGKAYVGWPDGSKENECAIRTVDEARKVLEEFGYAV